MCSVSTNRPQLIGSLQDPRKPCAMANFHRVRDPGAGPEAREKRVVPCDRTVSRCQRYVHWTIVVNRSRKADIVVPHKSCICWHSTHCELCLLRAN